MKAQAGAEAIRRFITAANVTTFERMQLLAFAEHIASALEAEGKGSGDESNSG